MVDNLAIWHTLDLTACSGLIGRGVRGPLTYSKETPALTDENVTSTARSGNEVDAYQLLRDA